MNGEHMSPESVVRFLCRFCSDDVTRPSLHFPWLSHGKCYATDGRIAIRLDPGLAPLSVERKHQCDAPLHASRDIDQWISSDYDDVKAHRREALPISRQGQCLLHLLPYLRFLLQKNRHSFESFHLQLRPDVFQPVHSKEAA